MSTKTSTSQLENRLMELEDENKRLHETVAYLTRKLYGSSSEKTSALGIEDQMSLFNEAEIEAKENAPEPTLDDVVNHRRKKFKGQREELLKDLPREKRFCSLVEEDRFCERCDSELHSIGEEFVRTEIEFIPAKVKVIDYYRETFECRSCRKKGEPYIEKAPMPYPVIQHSYASPSTVSWVIHQKYEMAIPLYRQEKEWVTMGVRLSRATMSKWIMVAYRDWLSPVINLLHKKLLQEHYMHCDETPVQVLQEPGRKNTATSYMWVYSTIKGSQYPIRFFEYQPGRGGKYPQTFLEGFKGYLHTDAYSGYNKVDGVIQCFCWAHVRRKFVDALPKNMENVEETIPGQAICSINKLFKIEQELQDVSVDTRKKKRLEQAEPELKAFWSWAEKTAPTILPKSKLGEAFGYCLNHKEKLMNYLKDGNCSISNNLSENSIRPFTIGRKNWLFSGSPKGATASAGVYTLIETAKANGLNPTKYIEYILKDIPGSAFMEYPEFLEEYMPWDPLVQKYCK